MTAIRDGQTETRSWHKDSPHPQPKLDNVGHCCWGLVSPAQHHVALPFLKACCSSCGKAMAATSSNKYHLCPNQPNRQPCRTRTCATTGQMQTTYLRPDEVCLASPLEWQPSVMAQTKTCQNGALPKPPTRQSKCRARQQIPGPNGVYLAWHLWDSISPPSLCWPVPKKSWQHGEAAPQVNWNVQLSGSLNLPTASQIK